MGTFYERTHALIKIKILKVIIWDVTFTSAKTIQRWNNTGLWECTDKGNT